MRRCNVRGLLSIACRRPLVPPRPAILRTPLRSISVSAINAFTSSTKVRISSLASEQLESHKYAVFEKIEPPERTVKAWTALLDGALPPHLRDWTTNASPPNLSAVDVAEVLLAAQNPSDPEDEPFDLLYHLGFKQDRWNAVVWLVKKLVDKFPVHHGQPSHLSKVNRLWDTVSLSDDTSDDLLAHFAETATIDAKEPETRSLDELTARQPDHRSELGTLPHDALGQVWRSLGAMTKACAGGDIRPEVLEIIAYLHHREVMPMSIYQIEPHPDKTAIQQPPLLSMLSSHIMTSLSDAAWRAHEKLVVEEAKARGWEYEALRPEVPGSVYRVRVTGLRPEVWIELILWSCIHGGWAAHGADILRSIVRRKDWKPLSWREYEKVASPANSDGMSDWSNWEYIFKTRPASTRDAPSGPQQHVGKTVSAEVVNAYIDVVVSLISHSSGTRGIVIDDAVSLLHELRLFLRQSRGYDSPVLSLSSGSWDGLALRLVDTGGIDAADDYQLIKRIVSLSLTFGRSVTSTNTQDLPDYVLDGNLALQGLLHRALYGQIRAGSVEGAIDVFHKIQIRADADKQQSLMDFIARPSSFVRSTDRDGMFISNLPGIDYPAFGVQIPPTILGSFLELLADAKQFKLGHWLLDNDDPDGPIVGEHLYKDPHVQPGVLRLAFEMGNSKPLKKLRSAPIESESYAALFHTQLDAGRWPAVARVLQNLRAGTEWGVRALANVARAMLMMVPAATAGDKAAIRDLAIAKTIFTNMATESYDSLRWKKSQLPHVRTLLFVLASVNEEWATFSLSLLADSRYQQFTLGTPAFNYVLEGVTVGYGSAAGRRLLETFWPHWSLLARHAAATTSKTRSRLAKLLNRVERQRSFIPVPRFRRELVFYGAVYATQATILIVLRKALEEVRAAMAIPDSMPADVEDEAKDHSAHEMLLWAVRRLATLPDVNDGVITSLDKSLSDLGLEDLRAELPEIDPFAGEDVFTNAEEDFPAGETRFRSLHLGDSQREADTADEPDSSVELAGPRG